MRYHRFFATSAILPKVAMLGLLMLSACANMGPQPAPYIPGAYADYSANTTGDIQGMSSGMPLW